MVRRELVGAPMTCAPVPCRRGVIRGAEGRVAVALGCTATRRGPVDRLRLEWPPADSDRQTARVADNEP